MMTLGLVTRRWLQPLFAALLCAALMVPLGTQPAHASITDIAGTYSGPWNDLTFQTTGTMTISIGFVGSTAQFDVLITGDALGGGFLSIPEQMFSAPVVGDNIVLNAPGLFSGLADLTGQISGSDGSVTATLGNFDVLTTGIDGITATGRIANETMHIDYTINIDPSTGSPFPSAHGTLDAVLVPETGTWALMIVGLGLLGWQVSQSKRAIESGS